MTKKKTKKYDMSRQDIANALDGLLRRLRDIDTYEMAPSEVSSEIDDVVMELVNLVNQVLDEA